jgi:hypothetical protein
MFGFSLARSEVMSVRHASTARNVRIVVIAGGWGESIYSSDHSNHLTFANHPRIEVIHAFSLSNRLADLWRQVYGVKRFFA